VFTGAKCKLVTVFILCISFKYNQFKILGYSKGETHADEFTLDETHLF